MKIVVALVGFELGGSEINAVELAASVAGQGHEVLVVGRTGPLASMARGLGLRVREVDVPVRGRPRPEAAWSLSRTLRDERPDLVHVYEAPSCTEAFFAAGWRHRVPVVATIYSMAVDSSMPRAVPTIAGTVEIQEDLQATRDPSSVFRLEPPIDTARNSPDEAEGHRQREAWGIRADEELVLIASRLDPWMKLDSLVDTIDAVGLLAARRPVRLAVVGEGPARDALASRAAEVNRRAGREVVTMAGLMLDPVPAYRAADVVVGMGTSVLRGMAVAKPSILVGQAGYVQAITPDTVEPLLYRGFWGVGDGRRVAEPLAGLIAEALDLDPQARRDRGDWGRSLVDTRFGLVVSTQRLIEIYGRVIDWSPGWRDLAADVARVPTAVAVSKVRNRWQARRNAGVRALLQSSPAPVTAAAPDPQR